MGPIILVLSYDSIEPIEIIKLLRAPNNDLVSNKQDLQYDEVKYSAYTHTIKNKYFETNVKLLPCDTSSIAALPKELLKSTEALIVRFGSRQKTFVKEIPKLCDFVKANNIELALLITDSLYDNCEEGLTYGDIKDICKNHFDVIETKNTIDDEDDGKAAAQQTSNSTKQDFSEIFEALENHVWSNVASPSGSKNPATPNAETESDSEEQQLEAYENLLTNIVSFKHNSANLNRTELLDQAEKLAELFANFMGDD